MASSKEYINFVLEQCRGLTARAMMGEYVLYYGGKIVGGVYDNRLLVKPTPSAKALMPSAESELPYEGAKEMLLVENIEDGEFLETLFNAMYEELPEPKKKKTKEKQV
ncbi:MAG: competence protein TfoX [Ruminococcaceae bacterium]|nr:competence protein TfoX [Oscillospiraceae bacterium]